MLTKDDMHGHQNKVSDFIIEHKEQGALAILDVGGGKTGATLDAISVMIDQFCCDKVLVVSTKRITQHVWPQEVKLWEQTTDLSVATREMVLSARQDRSEPEYLGAKKLSSHYAKIIKKKGVKNCPKDKLREYRKALRVMRKIEADQIMSIDADIFVINIDNFRWLVNTLGTRWPFDTVVLDESSLFRNSASRRFKAAKKIRPYISTVIELTGTPAPNGYMGLWAQVYLIDHGERLGKTITHYRETYFHKHYNGFTWVLNQGADVIIQDKIKDLVISLDPEDYIELGPDPIHEHYKLQMPEKLMKEYRKLENDYFLEVEGDSILALTDAVKSNKLRQFCNGTVYAVNENEFDKTKKVVQIHDIKLQALKEIVEVANGKPLIVAYEFIPERDKILKEFPKAKTVDQFSQEEWDNGDIEMWVVYPASAGHGLSLQHGGHQVVWYSTTFDLELYDQLNGRVGELRQAQSGYFRAPIYHHLYFENTIEEDVIKSRNKKDIDQKGLIKAMREGVKERRQVEVTPD